MRVIGSIVLYGYSAKNMVSQVDEAFCFDSVVCGHHVYKTVWTSFSGEILTATYRVSCRHSQLCALCLRMCSCHYVSPHSDDFMNVIKCFVYSRVTTVLLHSWSGVASIRGRPLNVHGAHLFK